MIVAAAIMFDGVVWSLPVPARHHHIIWAHHNVTGKGGSGEQGFLDEFGNFLGRVDAKTVAREAGQGPKSTGPDDMLFSEDLW